MALVNFLIFFTHKMNALFLGNDVGDAVTARLALGGISDAVFQVFYSSLRQWCAEHKESFPILLVPRKDFA